MVGAWSHAVGYGGCGLPASGAPVAVATSLGGVGARGDGKLTSISACILLEGEPAGTGRCVPEQELFRHRRTSG